MPIDRVSMFPASGGTRATKSIVNAFSTAGYTAASIVSVAAVGGVSQLSGALTANTLAPMLDITGAGIRMPHLTIRSNDAAARTLRVVVTVDGVEVYNRTSASFSAIARGCFLAGKGVAESSNGLFLSPAIIATSSLKIEIASNVTETDKFTTEYVYNTEG